MAVAIAAFPAHHSDYGKGDLFPYQWELETIKHEVESVANLESPDDICLDDPADQHQFILHGTRGYPSAELEIIVRKNNANIVTGYPLSGLGGLNPVDYYTDYDVLMNIFGESR